MTTAHLQVDRLSAVSCSDDWLWLRFRHSMAAIVANRNQFQTEKENKLLTISLIEWIFAISFSTILWQAAFLCECCSIESTFFSMKFLLVSFFFVSLRPIIKAIPIFANDKQIFRNFSYWIQSLSCARLQRKLNESDNCLSECDTLWAYFHLIFL